MATLVAPPGRTPHRHGVFSVATVIDEPDPRTMLGTRWAPLPCEHPGIYPGPCGDPLGPCPGGEGEGEGDGDRDEKCFTCQPPAVETEPFTVYGTYRCDLVGTTPERAADRALQHLLNGEQHAVEYALWTGLVGNNPHLANPDAVFLGDVSCAQELLATIYAYTDVAFTGSPVIHAPRPVIPWLSDHLHRAGGRLETTVGVPVIAGSGYTEANSGPDGVQAAPGSWWVYVTGPLVIRRGQVLQVPDPAVQGFNTKTNEFLALAERTYLVGWDCFTAALRFTPSCSKET